VRRGPGDVGVDRARSKSARALAEGEGIRAAAGLVCRPHPDRHLEHDPEKWVPVFGKRSCSTKGLQRDDDSNKSYPALGVAMLLFAVKRLLYVLPIALGVSVICFMLVYLAPGDPASALIPDNTPPAIAAQIREAYGFDKPVPVQYLRWLGRVLAGDL